MSIVNFRSPKFLLCLILCLAVVGLTSACTIRYVAEYDAEVKTEILRIAKEVDVFWGRLLEAPEAERPYSEFQEDYNRIEVDLRSLLLRNEMRPLNALSVKQAEIALELWQGDKARHKESDRFTDFIARRHQEQFTRVFVAMARGEEAKNPGQ